MPEWEPTNGETAKLNAGGTWKLITILNLSRETPTPLTCDAAYFDDNGCFWMDTEVPTSLLSAPPA